MYAFFKIFNFNDFISIKKREHIKEGRSQSMQEANISWLLVINIAQTSKMQNPTSCFGSRPPHDESSDFDV